MKFTGLCTPGLLLYLSRWGKLSPQAGGFVKPDHKSAALTMLQALLSALDHDTIQFKLVICEAWKCVWPRPYVVKGDTTCDVLITGDKVDVTDLWTYIDNEVVDIWSMTLEPPITTHEDGKKAIDLMTLVTTCV